MPCSLAVLLIAGGLRPAGPPIAVARGDPSRPAPLRRLVRFAIAGGLRPAGPPIAVARGDPSRPAPLRRLVRFALSLSPSSVGSLAIAAGTVKLGTLLPAIRG